MNYRLSTRAAVDLEHIVIYTIERWGHRQADRYLADMERKFELIATSPQIGRLQPGLRSTRRHEQGSHVILYRQTSYGIFVQRVLHKGMLPDLHPIEE